MGLSFSGIEVSVGDVSLVLDIENKQTKKITIKNKKKYKKGFFAFILLISS